MLREIRSLYENAGITTVHSENIRHKLKSLIHTAKSIIATRKLSTANQKQKELEFIRKVRLMFEISANERVDPPGNDAMNATESTINSDMEFETLSQNGENHEILSDYEMIEDEHMDDSSHVEASSDIEEYEPPRKRQKIPSELLKKINSECGQNASYRVMSSFIKIGIEIAGGDPVNYCVSKSHLQNQLSKLRSSEKNDTIEQLINSNSDLLLQFDTKTCSALNKRHLGSNLRLIIILRNETNVVTLGPYTISGHGAEPCSTKIISVITEYNLRNRIVGIVCDTESTNTGHLTGVCVRIEEFLERELLYFMCRHHIYDLVLKHVGQFLFGHSRAPTFDFGCTELRNAWENLDLAHFSPYDEELDFGEEISMHFRENAVQNLQLQAETRQTRDDYAELTDLALKFFGESNVTTKRFMVPGAVNNARWMARAIYVLKCYLFRHQLNIEDSLSERLRRFSLFISAIYVKYWNWCSNVFNATVNDLRFLKELEMYRQIDNDLANVAIQSFCRHLTYLSDEMVALSIFSNQLTDDEKERIRSKFQAGQSEIHTERTENSIQHIYSNENFTELELYDFITPRSMFLFHTLNIDASFLNHQSKNWKNLESYQRAREKMKNLFVVVNDSSERALGQTANAINNQKARTEENLQNFLTCKLKH